MGNENSSTGSSASDETQNIPRKKLWRPPTRAEEVVYSEQRGKKALSNDDAFNSFIKRGKHKFRSMATFATNRRDDISHASPEVANSANNKDDQKDNNFSDFIKHTKKKFRTTTIVGRNSSVKRG